VIPVVVYITAVILGFGSAILWIAQGKKTNRNERKKKKQK